MDIVAITIGSCLITGALGFVGGATWAHYTWIAKPRRTAQQAHSQAPLFHPLEEIFGNVRYRTEGSTILAVHFFGMADDRYERYLMKSQGGRYFLQTHSCGKTGTMYDSIVPYTKQQAMQAYNSADERRVPFQEAFGEKLLEA